MNISIFDYMNREFRRGYYYEYTGKKNGVKEVNKENIIYFNGNGDFRDNESIELLKNIM